MTVRDVTVDVTYRRPEPTLYFWYQVYTGNRPDPMAQLTVHNVCPRVVGESGPSPIPGYEPGRILLSPPYYAPGITCMLTAEDSGADLIEYG